MPLILMLIGGLVQAAGPIVAQVLLSMGIGFVAYSGIDLMLETMKTQVFGSFNAGGAVFLQFVGVFQLGTAVNIIASAYTARMTIAGITGGSITKMVTKK